MTNLLPRLAVAAFCAISASAAGAQEASSAAPPSASGICIAMALPTVKGAEDATQMATAVRELFVSYLQGPSINVVPLDAKLAVQATEEAKQKSCNQMLVASVTRKRGGGGGLGRALAQAGSTAAWYTPVGSVGTAAARGAVIAGAQAAAEIASSTKAKDELRLEYRLVATDGKVILKTKEEKAKASADGEDLMTPLVQTVSETIATAVMKKP
jgi:hypothetical protein